MAAHRTICRKVMKFCTMLKDSPSIDHSKFEVSNAISLAPLPVQSCIQVYANNLWTISHRKKILLFSGSLAQYDSIALYPVIFRHEKFSAIFNFTKTLLLLGCSSNFHKNWSTSSPDHADQKLIKSSGFVKLFSINSQKNLTKWPPKWNWGYIFAMH